MFKTLIDRLPSNYKKDKNSNLGKLYQVLADELDELRDTINKVKDYQDLDSAKGRTLDRIGRNVMELRSTDDDEAYRQYIKTKIISNLSKGDIETINQVAKVVLGGNFKGVSESWSNDLYDDIAGLIINIEPNGEYSFGEDNPLSRVKAGGIRMYFQAMLPEESVVIDEDSFHYGSRFKMAGKTRTKDKEVYTISNGLELVEDSFGVGLDYILASKTTRTKSSEASISESDICIGESSFDARVHYPISGISVCGGGR